MSTALVPDLPVEVSIVSMPETTTPLDGTFSKIYEAHHADNQRRFIGIEDKIAVNTTLTQDLRKDTAELLHMWKDASIFFSWMRKFGAVLIWLGKVASAVVAIWVLWKYLLPKQ